MSNFEYMFQMHPTTVRGLMVLHIASDDAPLVHIPLDCTVHLFDLILSRWRFLAPDEVPSVLAARGITASQWQLLQFEVPG